MAEQGQSIVDLHKGSVEFGTTIRSCLTSGPDDITTLFGGESCGVGIQAVGVGENVPWSRQTVLRCSTKVPPNSSPALPTSALRFALTP
jgi:hypothetical protein